MTDLSISVRKKSEKLARRRKRVHKRVFGTSARPRLIVYRSNKHIYAQIVDDVLHKTLVGCSSLSPAIKEKVASTAGKTAKAKVVGEYIAEIAKEQGITDVTFDRNGRRYHGRVKSLADGIRAGGLKV